MAAAALALVLGGAAALGPEARQLAALAREDARVLTIADRLQRRGAPICPLRAPQFGLVLHHRDQYGPAFRAAAVALWGLDDSVSVLAVAPEGAAARADVRAGDQVLLVDGANPAGAPPGDFRTTLSERGDRAARIILRRGGRHMTRQIAPEPGCLSEVRLVTSSRPRAAADGRRVRLTTPLVAFTRNDDELAFVIAHEIAHNAWGHAAVLATRSGSRLRKRTELEADAHALRLLALAGYDVRRVEPFVTRLYEDGPAGGLFASTGHVGRRERLQALRMQLQSNDYP